MSQTSAVPARTYAIYGAAVVSGVGVELATTVAVAVALGDGAGVAVRGPSSPPLQAKASRTMITQTSPLMVSPNDRPKARKLCSQRLL